MQQELQMLIECVNQLQDGALTAFVVYISVGVLKNLMAYSFGIWVISKVIKSVFKHVDLTKPHVHTVEELKLITDAKELHQSTCEHIYEYQNISSHCRGCGKHNGKG